MSREREREREHERERGNLSTHADQYHSTVLVVPSSVLFHVCHWTESNLKEWTGCTTSSTNDMDFYQTMNTMLMTIVIIRILVGSIVCAWMCWCLRQREGARRKESITFVQPERENDTQHRTQHRCRRRRRHWCDIARLRVPQAARESKQEPLSRDKRRKRQRRAKYSM